MPEKFMFAIGDRHLNADVSSKRVGNYSSQCVSSVVDPLSSVNADTTIRDETIQVKKMLKNLRSSLMKKKKQPSEKENGDDNQEDDFIVSLDDNQDDNFSSSLDDNKDNSEKIKKRLVWSKWVFYQSYICT